MKLQHLIFTPGTSGKIVEDYLKVLKLNTEYPAWTVSDKLEVVPCKGIIKNNGSWNYHNNYDDSKNELYVIQIHLGSTIPFCRWFSLNKEDAIKVQQDNIREWKNKLEKELERLGNLESKNLL